MNYLKNTFTFVTNNSTTDEKRDTFADNWDRIFKKDVKVAQAINIAISDDGKLIKDVKCKTTKPKKKKAKKKSKTAQS